MLAKRDLPDEFTRWNKRWWAPFGRPLPPNPTDRVAFLAQRLRGRFGFQLNSPTRRFEYPWVASQIQRGERVLELGGALSGLQFAIASDARAEVHNVDPFYDYGSGAYDNSPERRHAAMNKACHTNVVLHRCRLEEAHLEGQFDAVYSVSTVEHMPETEIQNALVTIDKILKPGGRLVLTVDLFLDVQPFCSATKNQWGKNVSVAWISDLTGYQLVAGDRAELFGFPEFATDHILCNLSNYSVHYSQLAQCFVLVKASATD